MAAKNKEHGEWKEEEEGCEYKLRSLLGCISQQFNYPHLKVLKGRTYGVLKEGKSLPYKLFSTKAQDEAFMSFLIEILKLPLV